MIFCSVIIPTFNRKEKIRKTILSLLSQSLLKEKFEIIIVDDGSTDSTKNVVKEFNKKVIYLRQENKGPAAARNYGIREASGEIVAFTDDDCVVPSNWLEKILSGFEKHKNVVAVGGYLEAPEEILRSNIFARYESFISRKNYRVSDKEEVSGWENPSGGTNNLAYLKRIILEVGGFDETFPTAGGEDADLKWRITQKGYKFLYLPLKVEHHQDYNFKGFIRQSRNRGSGEFYFSKKWGNVPTRITIFKNLVFVTLRFFKKLIFEKEIIMNILDFIFQFNKEKVKLSLL